MVLNIPFYFTPYLFIPAFQTQSLEEVSAQYMHGFPHCQPLTPCTETMARKPSTAFAP